MQQRHKRRSRSATAAAISGSIPRLRPERPSPSPSPLQRSIPFPFPIAMARLRISDQRQRAAISKQDPASRNPPPLRGHATPPAARLMGRRDARPHNPDQTPHAPTARTSVAVLDRSLGGRTDHRAEDLAHPTERDALDVVVVALGRVIGVVDVLVGLGLVSGPGARQRRLGDAIEGRQAEGAPDRTPRRRRGRAGWPPRRGRTPTRRPGPSRGASA